MSRVLAIASLVALGLSAYLAPVQFRKRGPDIPWQRLAAGPGERIAQGEREKSLGVALGGYLDSDDAEAGIARGRFEKTMQLWGVAIGQPGLFEMVREEIHRFLKRRRELDPDGKFVQQVLNWWIDQRLAYEGFFYARAGPAMFLAARGDSRGREAMAEFIRRGPLYREFCPYVRRFLVGWPAVEPIVRYYLDQGSLTGRIEAEATLIQYDSLLGVGSDLLAERKEEILRDLREGVARLKSDKREWRAHAEAVLFGLAQLGEAGHDILRRVREIDMDEHVVMFRMAKVLAGLTPFGDYRPGSRAWKLLDPVGREYYFRAGLIRYARLRRAGKSGKQVEEARAVAEAALVSKNTSIQISMMVGLMACDPEYAARLMTRFLRGGGPPSLFAAAMQLPTAPFDPYEILLPGVSSPMPSFSALAAVSLLDLPGPMPLPPPAK